MTMHALSAPEDAETVAPGRPVEDLRGRWPDAPSAYEWAFGDVNPPVHAWAAWRVR